jgi:hypothetical protein
MVFRPPLGHRMAGCAHLGILWHENMGFCRKTGHRMKKPASFFILRQENELEELLFRAGWRKEDFFSF